jgi:hypothetical protein
MSVPLHTRVLASVGHWDWEHEWKTCPTGERWCPHTHYKLDIHKLWWSWLTHWWFITVTDWEIWRGRGSQQAPQRVLDAYDRSTAAYNTMPERYRRAS